MKKYIEVEETCWKCRGKGYLIKSSSLFKRNFPESGTPDTKECKRCKGAGYTVVKKKISDDGGTR